MTFSELGVTPAIEAALSKQSITEPTPIQSAAIPALAEGKDAYLHSETGSGKTLAYLVPLFSRVDLTLGTQIIVLAPTHELAIQIQRQSCDLAQNAGVAIRTLLLIGGTSVDRQIEKLKKKPQIVIGSPGRVLELINMSKLKAKDVKALVIDEADRLLTAESFSKVQAILKALPKERQLVFVSATEQSESEKVVATLSPNVEYVRAAAAPINLNIAHRYLVCEERDKPDLLRKLLHAMQPERAIVFVHRNESAEIVASKLAHHKIRVADLHGASDKSERKKALDDFRVARVRVLIASDLAARGLDIAGISHVFNLDVPTLSKDYVHRVGRVARAGARGTAVSLFTERDITLLRRYRRDLEIEIIEISLDHGKVVELPKIAS